MTISGTSEYNVFPFGIIQKMYKYKNKMLLNLSSGICMWPPCGSPVKNQEQYCGISCISKHKHYRQVGATWKN